MDKWDPAKRLSFIAEKIKKQNEAQQNHALLADQWQGIAFLCGHESFIIPLKYIVEIIPSPEVMVIPGVKPWFLGVANLRGDMLPITDLQYLLGFAKTPIEKYTPVLVIHYEGELSGMLVQKVMGLYSLSQAKPHLFSLNRGSPFAPYASEVIQQGKSYFPLLAIDKLIDDPIFSHI